MEGEMKEMMEEKMMEGEEKKAGQFDEMKSVEGVDGELIDRASALMSEEEPEDETAYKTELSSVIADLKTAKDAAKEMNSMEAVKAYDEIVKQLEEFSSTLGGLEEDMAMGRGKKMAMIG